MSTPEFLNAAEYVKKLSSKPNNDELSKLYGLYKQSVVGNININEPSIFSIKEYQKWKAWNKYKNMSKFDAECNYITFVNELINKYGIK